MESLGLSQKDV